MAEEIPERKIDTGLVRKPIALFVDRLIRKILSGEYPIDRLKEYIDWVSGNIADIPENEKDALRQRAKWIEERVNEDFEEAFNLEKFLRRKR